MNNERQDAVPANASEARLWIAGLREQLAKDDTAFREPPEEPTTCCGRGCNGCVWESYLHAAAYWCEQARELIQKRSA